MTPDDIGAIIGGGRVEPFAIPFDMRDGFLGAYWRRPEAYLIQEVLANISLFALMTPSDRNAFVARLSSDLASGDWHRRNEEILRFEEMDLGYRLIVA
jgi:hypothetical protein